MLSVLLFINKMLTAELTCQELPAHSIVHFIKDTKFVFELPKQSSLARIYLSPSTVLLYEGKMIKILSEAITCLLPFENLVHPEPYISVVDGKRIDGLKCFNTVDVDDVTFSKKTIIFNLAGEQFTVRNPFKATLLQNSECSDLYLKPDGKIIGKECSVVMNEDTFVWKNGKCFLIQKGRVVCASFPIAKIPSGSTGIWMWKADYGITSRPLATLNSVKYINIEEKRKNEKKIETGSPLMY